MIKKFLALCLTASILLSLAACGGNGQSGTSADNLPADSSQTDTLAENTPSDPTPPDASVEAQPPVPEPPEEPVVRTVDPEKPMVALTFDDGPHSEYTDQILDILEANGAVATFFQVGRNLKNDPDAVRRAEAMGCEIGSHSYRHADLGKLSAEAIADDLNTADQAFTSILGHAPTLLRPPYGSMNYAVKATTGRSLITWSVDTQDWLTLDAEKIMAAVQSIADLNGEVVLMHDTYPSTVEAAKVLIPWLQEQGYQLVTVTELLTLHYGDELIPNGLYSFSYFRYDKPVEMPPAKPPQPITPAPEEEPVAPDPEAPVPDEEQPDGEQPGGEQTPDIEQAPDPEQPSDTETTPEGTPTPDTEPLPDTDPQPGTEAQPDPEPAPVPQPDPESSDTPLPDDQEAAL